jgi:hypothetical protein
MTTEREIALFIALLLALPSQARVVRVAELPTSEFADTEVATNVVIAVRDTARPHAEVSLALTASPSNCVEVSVGVDANGDGVLDLDEADQTFGYDCGTWFCRDARTDDFSEVAEPMPSGRVSRLFKVKTGLVDVNWNLVRIVRRGVAAVDESVSVDTQGPTLMIFLR